MMASASWTLAAIGFSTSTAMPASMQPSATSQCATVGTAIDTASTRPTRSRQCVVPAAPYRPPTSCARAASISATATSVASGMPDSRRA